MSDDFADDAEFVDVWRTIAPLLPRDKSVTHINGPALVVEKLQQLDDAAVVAYIAPSNERFWRKMLFACFDFTVSATNTFNVGHHYDYNNQPTAKMLVEDFHWWSNLGIYFRPSQYAFLHSIQSGETSKWPANEDAYTLFHELAMMKQVFGDMEGEVTTFSDGEQHVYPVLLSKMDESIERRGFPLLQLCGFERDSWERIDNAVSAKWSGLDPSQPPSNDTYREDYNIFPHAFNNESIVGEIKEVVTEWCVDWRHVRVNEEECCSPAFYIGKSKNSKRWLGFVGQRDH